MAGPFGAVSVTFQVIFPASPPIGGSKTGVARLLRELARAGCAVFRDGDGLGLASVEPTPQKLLATARAAAGDLLGAGFPVGPKPAGLDDEPLAHREEGSVVDLETVGPEGCEPGSERYVRECVVSCAVGFHADAGYVAWAPGAEAGSRVFVLEREGRRWEVAVEYVADAAAFAARLPGPWWAHNAAGFDARVFQAHGFPVPEKGWRDALPCARRLGLPGALDLLGTKVLGAGKCNRDALVAYEKARRPLRRKGGQASFLDDGKTLLPCPGGLLLDRLVAYCARDVEVLRALLDRAGLAADFEYAQKTGEHAVWAADLRAQERGFPVDEKLAEALLVADGALVQKRGEAAEDLSGVDAAVLRSPAKLRAWLAERGRIVGDTRRATLEALLQTGSSDPDVEAALGEDVEAVLGARLAEARVHRGKLAALLEDARDGRIRRWGTYYAAHTGRWGGRRFQPHNLPRSILGLDRDAAISAILAGDLDALSRCAKEARADESDVLASLLRAVVCAPEGRVLVAADFAQIEARVLLWCAGDAAGLAEFATGDPYAAFAARLDGKPAPTEKADPRRRLAKIAVLGLGYGQGSARFEATCAAAGLDLAALGVTAERVVGAWRAIRNRVVAFWKALEEAWAAAATEGVSKKVGPVSFENAGGAVVATLPSGRRVWYREPRQDKDGQWTFELARRGRQKVFGAKTAEHATSGIARDLLGCALASLEKGGLDVVLHVHDEVVVEVPEERAQEAIEAVRSCMQEGPAWAPGLPIKAEATAARRWA